MPKDLEKKYSLHARKSKRSVIREMLKLTERSDIISFSPGMPDPEVFPKEEITKITEIVLHREGGTALQYSVSEGDKRLKYQIIQHMKKDGVKAKEENILITSASQQGLDLVSKIFIDRGDRVVVELPSYLGGLGAFISYGAEFIGVELDEDGMQVDLLDEKLDKAKEPPKFIYVIPDFQNPAGVTLSVERRKELMKICEQRDLTILEDSPYRDLRYEGKTIPSLLSMDSSGRVIALYTFSKILFPGFRLGWIVAAEEIIDKLVAAKQSTDLCTSAFTQAVVNEYMTQDYLDHQIERIKKVYKEKKDVMLSALTEFIPKGVTWTKAEGGLFLWVTMPSYVDASLMLKEAIKEKVAYTPGGPFFADGSGQNTLRLNFSYPSISEIKEGVKRLTNVIKKNM